MPSDDKPSDIVEEEIAFWRGFIGWWEAKEGRPATLRMREALAYAEAKRGPHADTLSRNATSKGTTTH